MNKWKINRAGLFNFWYYDEEIFPFANGKLLLRGANGSGKSVTMQSFLPVLLDGKTSPDRLDPFGSRARRMEDYLLGEKGVVDRDERTGYLFMEFKRETTEQYLTIGIGLQAKRHKPMKFWGFVITDNRRIGKDIHLYKPEKHAGKTEKIPLSRVELENLIQEGGQVVQTKTEYMKLVNKHLFGFETLEAYEDLIKLLIQLRSPKLSKDFKPSVIYEILEAALPPLSDEDLRHLSDTIEQMDQTKQQIEQLEREAAAVESLNRVYRRYNQHVLADLANEFLKAEKRLVKEQTDWRQLEKKSDELQEEIEQLEKDIRGLKIQLGSYRQQKERLMKHDVWKLENERRQKLEQLEQTKKLLKSKEQRLQQDRTQENKLLHMKNELEAELVNRLNTMKDKLLDLQNDAEETSFADKHEINRHDFERHLEKRFDFSLWTKEAALHLEKLEHIKDDLQELEQLIERYQEKDRQLAEENQALDTLIRQEEEWRRMFEEDKERTLDAIHHWKEAADWLEISDEAMQDVARHLYELYEPTSYEQVMEPFRRAFLNFEQKQREILAQLNFENKQLSEAIREKENELSEWLKKKDPEPETDSLTQEARQQLREKGVSFIPFYQAVEFQEHVEPDMQKRVEAALLDSGLLDALLTEEEVAITYDRTIRPNPQLFAHTLADVLKPDLPEDSAIPARLVADVLSSITIGETEQSGSSVTVDGNYELGILKGHALPVDEVRYIGRNARKRFRNERIAAIKAEIIALEEKKKAVENDILEIQGMLKKAKTDLAQFPDDADLQTAYENIKKVRFEINQRKKHVERLSSEVKLIYNQFTDLKQRIYEATRDLDIENKVSDYQDAIAAMKRYEKDLSELEKEHIHYVNNLKEGKTLAERMNELDERMIELSGELNDAEDKAEILRQDIQHIDKTLKQAGVDDVHRQIVEVQDMLDRLEKALEDKKVAKPGKEKELEQVTQQVEEKSVKVDFWTNMTDTWKMTLERELQRGLYERHDDEKPLVEIAGLILKKHRYVLKEKNRSKLSEELTKEYYKQNSDLMEYRPNTFTAPISVPQWMTEWTEPDDAPYIDQWRRIVDRQIIELHYFGKQVSPFTLEEKVKEQLARQESLLDEQDRQLYEEILFNTVGQKLRARIRRAEKWVAQMKELMENRDTSSGLSFSIRWKPRTADSEMEMDTVDLVHLLRQDSKLLKEEDIDKVINHFRSKIERAKEMVGEGNEMQTLLQVLKEVLDYRKWFSFVLHFQREGEPRRELTNNQFYKFSGGEKAMAMYIPLFTACYSRYLEAHPDAPFIISLDEAFAGVDEKNIQEMFEIVEQLGFDYIMNSQILWGDYDTVGELSICELIRPKNDDCVSVIRYYWDGNKLNMEMPEKTEEPTIV